ncbi:hypothetical protein ABT117_09465 [Streptomyces sp. NPDC002262]|uniref:hypothetical protein n=1 Tax=Streptomyces sp. NPDC002262 TaxID=3154414 RepID=UPI00332A7599
MISEPELEGGAPFEATEVLTEERAPRPRRARPPWRWALGGALAASVLWGGGLYAYHAGQRQPEGVDLRGYESVEDLCERAELKGLEAVLGDRSGSGGTGPYLDEPAMSESSCSAEFGEGERQQGVEITYTLHKQTDPGPEFAARAKQHDLTEPIGGVGEQAFFSGSEDGGRMWVLDGQAVLEFSLYRNYIEDENGEVTERGAPDLTGIDVPLSQDALALLAALRK